VERDAKFKKRGAEPMDTYFLVSVAHIVQMIQMDMARVIDPVIS
jgi:hypothetical protein